MVKWLIVNEQFPKMALMVLINNNTDPLVHTKGKIILRFNSCISKRLNNLHLILLKIISKSLRQVCRTFLSITNLQ